jgi:hypothetical protein
VRQHPEELRKWMLEYKISDEFMGQKQAPKTRAKDLMVATEEASVDALLEVKQIIEDGCEYVCPEVLSSKDLYDELERQHMDLVLNNVQKSRILKILGYQQYDCAIKIDGHLKRIWLKGDMNRDEIRTVLEVTKDF